MVDSGATPDRRTFTPAIVASAVFAAACAVFAIAFVSARGGLQLPIASDRAVGAASPGVTSSPAPVSSPGAATAAPTQTPATTPPGPSPTAVATIAPTPAPTFAIPTLEPGDPLFALPECPERPGCFEYVVARFDTLSGIISRYLLDIDVLQALNPNLTNPSLIVVGQLLYLGRDPLARLEPCPDGAACVLYVVEPGDSIAEIADRYLMTREAILEANPDLPRPIEAGQVIRLSRLAVAI